MLFVFPQMLRHILLCSLFVIFHPRNNAVLLIMTRIINKVYSFDFRIIIIIVVATATAASLQITFLFDIDLCIIKSLEH